MRLAPPPPPGSAASQCAGGLHAWRRQARKKEPLKAKTPLLAARTLMLVLVEPNSGLMAPDRARRAKLHDIGLSLSLLKRAPDRWRNLEGHIRWVRELPIPQTDSTVWRRMSAINRDRMAPVYRQSDVAARRITARATACATTARCLQTRTVAPPRTCMAVLPTA